MDWYPLQLTPILKDRIWGGTRLKEVFHKDLPDGRMIGESWEVVDLPDDQSVVANGPLAGLTLVDIVRRWPRAVTGSADFQLPFPLLVKFLDAQHILSVQVHPDAEACLRLGEGQPKTECWVILDASPGSFIYKGLKAGVTEEVFRRSLADGTVEQRLNKVTVRPGDCHFLPAGTIHAIGPGLLIAEIQQPSDTTYRVYDFGRVDHTGKPRPLHIAQAMESIHFDASMDNLAVTTAGRLVDCPFFKVDRTTLAKGRDAPLAPGLMQVVVILSGQGLISDAADQGVVPFQAGDSLLIPAAYEGIVRSDGPTVFLIVTLPAGS